MSRLRTIIQNQFGRHWALFKFGRQLRLTVDNTAALSKNDIILVTCLRNELFRLPFFTDYYRKLGVRHFLIVDNDSNDGLLDWARNQKDVSVWHTKESYRASNFGMEWCNYLLRKYGCGRLCVTVDPDEFLVYPNMETRDLRDLGEFMKNEKRDALHCVMLDAYGAGPLSQAGYATGDDPFKVCPYFDRDGYVQEARIDTDTYTRGGPRMRVYNRNSPQNSPALNKVPVVWWRWTYRYTSSMHDIRPRRLHKVGNDGRPAITGALFHFKFLASLQDKAKEEMHRKEHYNASAEYRKYVDTQDPVFFCDGLSVAYESPEQLIRLGLINRGNWF
jgi:Glycosyl transferase family 2